MTPYKPLLSLAGLSGGIHAYDAAAAARKDSLHRSGRTFLRLLAADLGLAKGTFEIRSNLGGIAVSGEVTLHTDRLYVQLSESFTGRRGVSVRYGNCRGRKDYGGGENHFAAPSALLRHYPDFLARLQMLSEGQVNA